MARIKSGRPPYEDWLETPPKFACGCPLRFGSFNGDDLTGQVCPLRKHWRCEKQQVFRCCDFQGCWEKVEGGATRCPQHALAVLAAP